jgi:hypothetical protein
MGVCILPQHQRCDTKPSLVYTSRYDSNPLVYTSLSLLTDHHLGHLIHLPITHRPVTHVTPWTPYTPPHHSSPTCGRPITCDQCARVGGSAICPTFAPSVLDAIRFRVCGWGAECGVWGVGCGVKGMCCDVCCNRALGSSASWQMETNVLHVPTAD